MTTTTTIQTNNPVPDRLYYRIGDVADLVGVKPYVLRYWESEFPIISPEKSPSGQRVYRRSDVETLIMIKHLLYEERYSIEGARRRIAELRKQGELRAFKKEAAQGSSAVAGAAAAAAAAAGMPDAAEELLDDSEVRYEERRRKILSVAHELREMTKMPIDQMIG